MVEKVSLMKQPALYWKSATGLYRVKIERRCFLRMRKMAIEHAPIEVGTTLVGYYSENGHRAVATNIGPLSADSKGTHYGFVRGVAGLIEYFTKLHRRFRGHRYRIGEWHSHPANEPLPSDIDDRNQTQLANDAREVLPEAILVIIGSDLNRHPQTRCLHLLQNSWRHLY